MGGGGGRERYTPRYTDWRWLMGKKVYNSQAWREKKEKKGGKEACAQITTSAETAIRLRISTGVRILDKLYRNWNTITDKVIRAMFTKCS